MQGNFQVSRQLFFNS